MGLFGKKATLPARLPTPTEFKHEMVNEYTRQLLASIQVKGEMVKVLQDCIRFLKTGFTEDKRITFERQPIKATNEIAERIHSRLWKVPDLGRIHNYEKIRQSNSPLEAHLCTLEGLLLRGSADNKQRRLREAVFILMTKHCRKELLYVLLPLARQWKVVTEPSFDVQLPDKYDDQQIALAALVAKQNKVTQEEVNRLLDTVFVPKQSREPELAYLHDVLVHCAEYRETPRQPQLVLPEPAISKAAASMPRNGSASTVDVTGVVAESAAQPMLAPDVAALAEDAERIFDTTLISHRKRASRLRTLPQYIERAGEAMRSGKARRKGDGLWYTMDIIDDDANEGSGKNQKFSQQNADATLAELSIIHRLLERAGFSDSLADGALEACSASLVRSLPLYLRNGHLRESQLSNAYLAMVREKLDSHRNPVSQSGKSIADHARATVVMADALRESTPHLSKFSGECGFVSPQPSWPAMKIARIVQEQGSAPAWITLQYSEEADRPFCITNGHSAGAVTCIEQERIMGTAMFPGHSLTIDELVGEGNDVSDAATTLARHGACGLHRALRAAEGAHLHPLFEAMRVANIPLRCIRYEGNSSQTPFLFLFQVDAAEHLGLGELAPLSSQCTTEVPHSITGDPSKERVLLWLPPEERAPLSESDIDTVIRKYLSNLDRGQFPLRDVEDLVAHGYVWLDRRHRGSKHPLWRGNGRSWAMCGEDWQNQELTKKHLLQLFFENVAGTGAPIIDKRAFHEWLQQGESKT